MNGTNHAWGGIDSDHYIDVFNMNDENIWLVILLLLHGGGTFSFDLVSSKGVASGPATIKIFKSEGTVDFDQYVKPKAGDSMTGMLSLDPSGLVTLFVLQQVMKLMNVLFCFTHTVNQIEEGQRPILFSVVADGRVSVSDKFKPTSSTHLTPKSYVDSAVAESPAAGAAQFRWYVDTNKSESALPAERHAVLVDGSRMDSISKIRFHLLSGTGHKLSFPHSNEPIYTGTSGNGPFLTAWYYNSSTKQWTWRGSAKISKLNVVNSYLEADLTSRKGTQSLNNGTTYYFTIGGFFYDYSNNPSLNEEWTNGVTNVTYQWDGERWIIITHSSDSLDDYVTKVTFEADQERQDDTAECSHGNQINALETQLRSC